MLRARIQFFIFKPGLWPAYGPNDCVVEATSLPELRLKLWTFVHHVFGRDSYPVMVVGSRKPAQSVRPETRVAAAPADRAACGG